MVSGSKLLYILIFSLLIVPTATARDYYPGGTQEKIITAFAKLEPTHKLSCISPEQVSNQYTPIDLTKAAVRCFNENKPNKGVFLFRLAELYTRFDEERVFPQPTGRWSALLQVLRHYYLGVDDIIPAAENILIILRTGAFETLSDTQQVVYYKAQEDSKKNFDNVCNELKHVGMPNYYPDYLLENVGNKKLVANFKPHRTWKRLLSYYCNSLDKTTAVAAQNPICLAPQQLNSKNTPAELYPNALQCFRQGKAEEGTFSFVLARMYIDFDEYRVKNKELAALIKRELIAHSFHALGGEKDNFYLKKLYYKTLGRFFEDKQQSMCHELRLIGMPTYFPNYIKDEDDPSIKLRTLSKTNLQKEWNKIFNVYCYNLEETKQ